MSELSTINCGNTSLVLHTVFTWLNAMDTINNLLNFDVATIQGRPLTESGVYCTEEHLACGYYSI